MEDTKVSKKAQAAATAAKKTGVRPVYVTISGREYVYRGMTRGEWADLRRDISAIMAKLQTELAPVEGDAPKVVAEKVAKLEVAMGDLRENEMEKVVALAKVYYENEEGMGAGVVETLTDLIMQESGFGGPELEPVRL